MADDATKQPLPDPAAVPRLAPLVASVTRAKAGVASATEGATNEGVLQQAAPAYRAARKKLKRAQRRLRRELRRAAVTIRAAQAAEAKKTAGEPAADQAASAE